MVVFPAGLWYNETRKGGITVDKLDMPERFCEMSIDRKMFLLSWINENLIKIKTFNEKHTSYGLKHLIHDEYFTNGEFKGAMLECGYKVKDKYEQNWIFNVSERSPAIVKSKKY